MNSSVYEGNQAAIPPGRAATGTPSPRKARKPATSRSSKWLVTALLLLAVVPIAAGTYRLIQLTFGAEVTPANARFFAAPLPVVVHIVTAAVFCLLGPFQIVTGFRRQRHGWHRAAGRVVVIAGLLNGLSALWMTLFYPRAEGTGDLLFILRLGLSTTMVGCIVLGYVTIRRREVMQHRAWMIRAYAIGLGAGTQVLTGALGALVIGQPNELSNDLLMGLAWALNLAIAEWAIRRHPQAPSRPASAVAPQH